MTDIQAEPNGVACIDSIVIRYIAAAIRQIQRGLANTVIRIALGRGYIDGFLNILVIPIPRGSILNRSTEFAFFHKAAVAQLYLCIRLDHRLIVNSRQEITVFILVGLHIGRYVNNKITGIIIVRHIRRICVKRNPSFIVNIDLKIALLQFNPTVCIRKLENLGGAVCQRAGYKPNAILATFLLLHYDILATIRIIRVIGVFIRGGKLVNVHLALGFGLDVSFVI